MARVLAGVEINVGAGSVYFTSAEAEHFAALFTIVDSDCDDSVDGAQGAGACRGGALTRACMDRAEPNRRLAAFLSRSGLPRAALQVSKTDWRNACCVTGALFGIASG